MFDKTKVEAMVGIIGARQPLNPTYAILDAPNIASESGYFVTDIEHVKIEFFKDAQDYEAIENDDFNDLLRQVQKSAIVDVCNLVFNKEDFQDRNLVYTNASNNIDAETLEDGFVGYQILVKKERNFAFKITRVILDFDSNFPNDIVLQLYNTGDPNPLQEKTITITEQHQVEQLDWVVDNSGDTYKGDYYLGYVKSATTPVPFKRNYNNSNVVSHIEGLKVLPMQVKGHTGSTLFDLTALDGLGENIGVNPDILTYDDYTDFILQNKSLFAPAINLKMAILMLQTATSSIRVNRNQAISSQDTERMLQTLNGVDIGNGKLRVKSLHSQLTSSIETIQTEVGKLQLGYHGGRILVGTRS
jgi:hypothetical protein